MAARISLADLSDATGIAPEVLAAEVAAIQREGLLAPPCSREGSEAPPSARAEREPPPPAQAAA